MCDTLGLISSSRRGQEGVAQVVELLLSKCEFSPLYLRKRKRERECVFKPNLWEGSGLRQAGWE
jgi:hypothetical protein